MSEPTRTVRAARTAWQGLVAMGLAAALSWAPLTAHAAASGTANSATSGVAQQIADHFSSVRTMAGAFIQFGPRGEQTGGTFYIERPGKIRFDYEEPSGFRVVSDGQSVVIYNDKLRTADLYPLSKTPLKLLLDSRIDLSGNKVESVQETKDLITIKLADASLFGDSTIAMMFDPESYALRQWTITDAQGKEVLIRLESVSYGASMANELFATPRTRRQQGTR